MGEKREVVTIVIEEFLFIYLFFTKKIILNKLYGNKHKEEENESV